MSNFPLQLPHSALVNKKEKENCEPKKEGVGAFFPLFFLLQSSCSSWRLFEAEVFGSNGCGKVKTVAAVAMDQAANNLVASKARASKCNNKLLSGYPPQSCRASSKRSHFAIATVAL